jgi:hypothetical protein
VRVAGETAKLGRVWPHMLRHSCGYYLADQGTDLRTMSVGAGDERLGLFVTRQQALNEVKKRRARLTAEGQRSTVLVTGHELASPSGRGQRYYPYR